MTKTTPDSKVMYHYLKTLGPYFDAVEMGCKNFEIRLNDREFQKGDYVQLRRYADDCYTEGCNPIEKRISYVLQGGRFGIQEGYVILGLQDV